MTPTTDQLKDLLAKVTQGEWRVEEGANSHCFDLCIMAEGGECVGFSDDTDATLIALAPTLAAEVVRLREALAFYDEHHQDPNAGPWGVNSNDYGNIASQALSQNNITLAHLVVDAARITCNT